MYVREQREKENVNIWVVSVNGVCKNSLCLQYFVSKFLYMCVCMCTYIMYMYVLANIHISLKLFSFDPQFVFDLNPPVQITY